MLQSGQRQLFRECSEGLQSPGTRRSYQCRCLTRCAAIGDSQGPHQEWKGIPVADMSAAQLVQCIQAGMRCGSRGVAADLAAAAGRLRGLARESQWEAKKVLEAGALLVLTDLLQSNDRRVVEQAATAVLNLTLHDCLRGRAAHHRGLIPALVAALSCPCAGAQSSAAAALCSLTAEAREEVWAAGVLAPLLHILRVVGDARAKKDAAHCLLSLSLSKEHRSAIAQAGAVPALCAILEEEQYGVDTEIAGVLAALSRDDTGRARMLEAGAVAALAELLETGATQCSKEYAVTALLQLAARCRACLESIYNADVTLPLDMLTRAESLETQVKARALQAFLQDWEAAHCPQEARVLDPPPLCYVLHSVTLRVPYCPPLLNSTVLQSDVLGTTGMYR